MFVKSFCLFVCFFRRFDRVQLSYDPNYLITLIDSGDQKGRSFSTCCGKRKGKEDVKLTLLKCVKKWFPRVCVSKRKRERLRVRKKTYLCEFIKVFVRD